MMNASSQKAVRTKLAKGLLDIIILEQLQKETMHGYQLITNIRRDFGVLFGPSTIYPLLAQLEKKGYVVSAWNLSSVRPRKEYALTEQGKDLLSLNEKALALICNKITPEISMKPQNAL
jgi:DNA-binding PadR family transcriptional regulator